MFVYEVIPSYIFPLLNGFNIFCLASQHAPQRTQDVFTNLFGGSDGNEGLGFLSLSFDWQYIGSTYMSLPLIQQGECYDNSSASKLLTPYISKFLDRIRLVLHYTHGHLLLECLGGSLVSLALLSISITRCQPLGSIFPHAVVLYLLFKRFEIPSDSRIRHDIQAQ